MTELTAVDVNVALEALCDRTACLVPDVQTFTSTGSWTKPAHALWVEFIVVDSGFSGGDSAWPHSGGAGGGASGSILHRVLPASVVPSTVALTVATAPGAHSVAYNGTFSVNAYSATTDGTGGDGGDIVGSGGGVSVSASSVAGGNGGAGQPTTPGFDGDPGGNGYCSDGLTAGAGGTTPSPTGKGGNGGVGYGAGGGGAGGNGGAATMAFGGGAGAGASGYGLAALATAGQNGTLTDSGTRVGGIGAPGVIIITTWRGVAL